VPCAKAGKAASEVMTIEVKINKKCLMMRMPPISFASLYQMDVVDSVLVSFSLEITDLSANAPWGFFL
jgi:hypothetical protein